ncbi:MAG: hypothetical protein WC825_05655 [Gallionellaceae bacterium]|jgi:hypothetical protein
MLKKLFASLAVAAIIALPCTSDIVAAKMGYAPQISDKQNIKLTVVPQNIPKAEKNWDFEVTMESHTQALNDDLTKSAVLTADGKQYLPVAWEGAPPGGHHRKGLLRFKVIAPMHASMKLQIRLAGDALPRSFEWVLK